MKPKFTSLLNSGLFIVSALFAQPALALEAPEDNALPPAARRSPSNLPQIKLPASPTPQATPVFLGIVTGPLPAVLSEHLSLNPTEGVIVHSLVPDSPASKAGIAINDVITKVAGKAIGSSSDLRQQIAQLHSGDKITVEFIHKGNTTRRDLILAARPAALADAGQPQVIDPKRLQDLPEDLADRIRNSISGNIGGLDLQLGTLKDADADHLHDAVQELFERQTQQLRHGGMVLPGDDANGKIQLQSGATVKVQDQEGSVEVHANGNDKQVTIRDPQNQVTWSGPWNDEKDKSTAPASVSQRMALLNLDTQFEGSGLRFKMQR